MDNIFRGERVTKESFLEKLGIIEEIINNDLLLPQLDYNIVINALEKLSQSIDRNELEEKLVSMNFPRWSIHNFIEQALKSISKKEMLLKVKRELGENPFQWREVGNHLEKERSLGVIMHIGAGNALGLSAMSVLEGLITGNINILKLPNEEKGISSEILNLLIEIEPKLKPYIYVIDVSSKDTRTIHKLIQLVDAVAVWGGDQAIDAIRKMTPPTVKLIEWGHRISFSYFTELNHEGIKGLAYEIITTDQLYCSSPQVIFLESDTYLEVIEFGERLLTELSKLDQEFPSADKSINVESQITWERELIKAEEIYGSRLLVDESLNYSVMVQQIPVLKPAPLFRNIWLMPIKRHELPSLLRPHKGHLQTVGVCSRSDKKELEEILYSFGVNRIKSPESMSSVYSGEPHDGEYALNRYIRIINKEQ